MLEALVRTSMESPRSAHVSIIEVPMSSSLSNRPAARTRRTPALGFGPSLAVAAAATTLAALWLAWTVLTVLPSRDPNHIVQWGAIAAGMLAFAALSFATLRAGAAPAWLRVAAAVPGVPAIGLGVGAVARMLALGQAGGHFEGYIVLLGAIVAVHGLVALAHALAPGAAPR